MNHYLNCFLTYLWYTFINYFLKQLAFYCTLIDLNQLQSILICTKNTNLFQYSLFYTNRHYFYLLFLSFFLATYANFQLELWNLRHLAAKVTLDALNASERTISEDITQAPIKLSAEVCGVGPLFRLYLTIQNLSTYRMASNLMILMHADRRHYNFNKSVIKVSFLHNQKSQINYPLI